MQTTCRRTVAFPGDRTPNPIAIGNGVACRNRGIATRVADHAAVIEKGRIAWAGTMSALQAT